MRIKTVSIFGSIFGSLLILTSCMSSTIDEEIKQSKKNSINAKNETNQEEITPDNVKLPEEQQKALDELEKKSAEEALYENDLDTRKELDSNVPEKKKFFTNAEEFSQYISHLFFTYDKGDVPAEAYLDELLVYAHPDYLENFPNNRENQLLNLKNIKKQITDKLRAPIESYVITELNYEEKIDEATFYRKYILENKEELYFVTVLKQEGDSWKLYDDSPSTPYVSIEFLKEKIQKEGESK